MERSPIDSTKNTPLGVYTDGTRVLLYSSSADKDDAFLHLDSSVDGLTFTKEPSSPIIADSKKRVVMNERCREFRITKLPDGQYFLAFTYFLNMEMHLYGAVSTDLVVWRKLGKLAGLSEIGMVIPEYQWNGMHVMLYGDHSIRLAYSKDFTSWECDDNVILDAEKDFYGAAPLKVASVRASEKEIELLYYVRRGEGENVQFLLKRAYLDHANPRKVIRVENDPLWDSKDEWVGKHVQPIGVVKFADTYISYWHIATEGLFAVVHAKGKPQSETARKFPMLFLQKFADNPILKPITHHFWESKATFNPAALYEKGKVHLLYRAIGDHDVSVIGYAASSDGLTIDERLNEPAYVPTQPFESTSMYHHAPRESVAYASGGGVFGGCEDPRITKVNDRVYMTYVAYNGWGPPRVAMTSIALDDFLGKNWRWDTPVLISKPGEINKNACILPEKINGKYVLFHRVFPNILVDYVDDLNFDGESRFLEGHYKIRPMAGGWDSRKVGVGATPVKTKDGWLLIYQAVGDRDPGRYKMGAMLLDLDRPERVIARTNRPILAPDEWYENEGYKAGVAYPCGAIVKDDQLFVYYGGADTVVCAATAPLPDLLNSLQSSETIALQRVTRLS